MKKILLTSLFIFLAACDGTSRNPQASQSSCAFLWGTFKQNMQKAGNAEHIDKIYYTQIAQMNLDTLLARGCCKYADSCPAAIDE